MTRVLAFNSCSYSNHVCLCTRLAVRMSAVRLPILKPTNPDTLFVFVYSASGNSTRNHVSRIFIHFFHPFHSAISFPFLSFEGQSLFIFIAELAQFWCGTYLWHYRCAARNNLTFAKLKSVQRKKIYIYLKYSFFRPMDSAVRGSTPPQLRPWAFKRLRQ